MDTIMEACADIIDFCPFYTIIIVVLRKEKEVLCI